MNTKPGITLLTLSLLLLSACGDAAAPLWMRYPPRRPRACGHYYQHPEPHAKDCALQFQSL